MILYILGNGFDLHFGLPTSTKDFKQILKEQSIYNEIGDALDVFESYGVNWSDYEASLANLDLLEIEESNIQYPNYLANHEYERDDTVLNMKMYLDSLNNAIKNALSKMVEIANVKGSNVTFTCKDKSLFYNAKGVISFNYTSTFEYMGLKEIPILHVHGYYADNEELIFGYNNIDNDYKNRIEFEDYYLDQQRQAIIDFYEGWRKELKLSLVKSFLDNIKENIDTIVVLGHSLSIIDKPYFELIESIIHPSKWIVYYHDKNVLNNIQYYPFMSHAKLVKW